MTALAEAYRRERRARPTLPARYALDAARWTATTPALDWHSARNGDEYAEWNDGPFTLRATVSPDYDSGPDYGMGTVIDGWPDSLESAVLLEPSDMRSARDWPNYTTRRPRWYVSDYTLAERIRDESRTGASRSVARERARAGLVAEARQETADDRSWYAVTVTASAEGIELGRASVGAIETSGHYAEDRRYMDETARDIAPEALDEARDALARLRAVTP